MQKNRKSIKETLLLTRWQWKWRNRDFHINKSLLVSWQFENCQKSINSENPFWESTVLLLHCARGERKCYGNRHRFEAWTWTSSEIRYDFSQIHRYSIVIGCPELHWLHAIQPHPHIILLHATVDFIHRTRFERFQFSIRIIHLHLRRAWIMHGSHIVRLFVFDENNEKHTNISISEWKQFVHAKQQKIGILRYIWRRSEVNRAFVHFFIHIVVTYEHVYVGAFWRHQMFYN